MSKTLQFQITTPERIVYQDTIDSVSLATQAGDITVLPGHTPLISGLKPGEMKIKKGDHEFFMAVSGGFIQVQPKGKVVILADTAEREGEISEERAEEAKRRAQELMKEKKLDKTEMAAAAAMLEKSLTRLRVVRRRKTKA